MSGTTKNVAGDVDVNQLRHLPEGQILQHIVIQARGTLMADGSLLGRRFSTRQRWQRGAMAWAILWALALATAAVPVAHFVLTPILLVAGPIAGYLRYRMTEQLASMQGECPLCRRPFTLKLDAGTALPYWDNCPECGDHIRLASRANERERQPN